MLTGRRTRLSVSSGGQSSRLERELAARAGVATCTHLSIEFK
jgi:hypothetical protein